MTSWTDYQDDISDAISESMDVDWSASVGARAVVAWLNEHKPLMADTPCVTVPVADLERVRDLLMERIHGSPARSPAHNARLEVEALLSAAPAPEGGAVDGPEDDELPGDFLARVGMDGALWADGFRKMALKLGYSDMDEGWLIGWFCNAVMAGYDHAQRRFDPALVTREEAPAGAGEDCERCSGDCSAANPPVLDCPIRAQPQACEDAQPVARAHVRLEDDGLFADLEVLNGEHLQVEHSPVDLFLHPAPDALRLAVEALKFAISWIEDLPRKNASHAMRDDKLDEVRQALAALQAEQKGGAV